MNAPSIRREVFAVCTIVIKWPTTFLVASPGALLTMSVCYPNKYPTLTTTTTTTSTSTSMIAINIDMPCVVIL